MIRWVVMGALTAVSALAEPVKKEGVSVELVSEHAALAPGATTGLAVILRHQPGFHTYWRQPGIVGLATSLKWTLPAGFAAGDILWPAPERARMAHWGVWGFERDVALVVPITAPRDLDPARTRSVTLSVQANWMACGETCHPGTAALSITLPVSEEAVPSAAGVPLIARTRDEQAVARPEWKTAANKRMGGKGIEGFDLVITPPAGRAVPKDAYFFSRSRLVDSHPAQPHRLNADGSTTIALDLVESPDPMPKTFEGELQSAAGWDAEGAKHLLMVSVPLGD